MSLHPKLVCRPIAALLIASATAVLLGGCNDELLSPGTTATRRTEASAAPAVQSVDMGFWYPLTVGNEWGRGYWTTSPEFRVIYPIDWYHYSSDGLQDFEMQVAAARGLRFGLGVGYVFSPTGPINSWFDFSGAKVSHVRLQATPTWGSLSLRCSTGPGGPEFTASTAYYEELWPEWTVLEVSGSGITKCVIAGQGWIKDVVYSPEPKQQPKLILACTPTPNIIRGDSIACVAQASPTGATKQAIAWSFVDSASHTIAGPTGADTAWGGKVVVPGWMKVSASVNGVALSDSLFINPTKRTWPRLRLFPREDGHGDLPYPPTQYKELADTHVDEVPDSLRPTVELTRGPNAGWVFLDSVPRVVITTHINRSWQPTDPWYQMQHSGVAGVDIYGNTAYYCTQSQMGTALTLTRRHEGTVLSMHNSHYDVFVRFVNGHNQHEELERQVLWAPPSANFPADTVATWFRSAVWNTVLRFPMLSDPAQVHTNQPHPGLVPPALFPCQLRF